MRIIVTGANGFIGKEICQTLLSAGHVVCAVVRAASTRPFIQNANLEIIAVGEITSETNWSTALKNVDIVIHTAARVHINDKSSDSLKKYRQTNTEGTLHLMRSASYAGVKRFIFLSSISVNVLLSKINSVLINNKLSNTHNYLDPIEWYALSKWEAEQGIKLWCEQNKTMDYTIIRLPLTYGADAKANFARLMKLVKSGLPLPMGSIRNKRSFLYIGNLLSVIITILENRKAANQTYLLSDNDDISTPELIRLIANAYKIKVRLIPVPVVFLKLIGFLCGKSAAISRLIGSLQIDVKKIKDDLNWQPSYTVASGLAEMVSKHKELK